MAPARTSHTQGASKPNEPERNELVIISIPSDNDGSSDDDGSSQSDADDDGFPPLTTPLDNTREATETGKMTHIESIQIQPIASKCEGTSLVQKHYADEGKVLTSFRNKADLYSSSHPYGRVVARMGKRQRFGTRKLPFASRHYEPGSGTDHKSGPPVLAHKTSTSSGSFRILGDDIKKLIFSHLDYQSLISLSQASHHFREMARPEQASPQDKFQLVMRAEKEFKQHFPDGNSSGNLTRYFCYRVLRADSFRDDQAHEAFVNCDGEFVLDIKPENTTKCTKSRLRRYCRTCGCKIGFDRLVQRIPRLDQLRSSPADAKQDAASTDR